MDSATKNETKYKRVPFTKAREIGVVNTMCLEEASMKERVDAAWSGWQNCCDTLDEVLAENGYLVDINENPLGDEEYGQEIRDHVFRLTQEMEKAFCRGLKRAYQFRWSPWEF